MTVGIIGLGYVGLPLAVAFAEAGERVIGLDTNAGRIAALRRGESHVEDVSDERLRAASARLEPTTMTSRLALSDAILICVPTPLTRNREPDLTALLGATTTVATVLQRGQVVILESTTYPGTTRERVLPMLEETGLSAGRDFHLAFSPERVDPGRTDYTLRTTPKVLGGLTPQCAERAAEVYGAICDHLVPVSTLEVAEMSKLLENVFRAVNIALVNELAVLADRMELDIFEVVEAASTKPYGFMRFDPGPGMGGHCLPVDPFYLSWKAREYELTTEFIELAGKVNQQTPYFCVEKIERALNDLGRPVRDSRVLMLGVSYKQGVGDVRESPALKILAALKRLGADLRYHDAFVPELPQHDMTSAPDLDAALTDADLAVIVTAHPGIDFAAVAETVPTVDLRGVTRKVARTSKAKEGAF
jgi:UDP-N-acetyl-D-glucosamine dehydrogenase